MDALSKVFDHILHNLRLTKHAGALVDNFEDDKKKVALKINRWILILFNVDLRIYL